jgi:parallel beta-helix repeat protein
MSLDQAQITLDPHATLTHVLAGRSRMVVGMLAAFAALLVPILSSTAATGTLRSTAHLHVSPGGSDTANCTQSAPCRTIQRAVQVAQAGQEIDVAPGSYSGQVTVTKRLTIRGHNHPVLDATGHGRGFYIKGHAAAGSAVEGMVIEGATYEAILALRTKHVLISGNVARNNDRGFFNHVTTGECAFNGQPPGIHRQHAVASPADERSGGCGESIHLDSTSDSRVIHNLATGNTGGIYLTDDFAPAAHNTVAHNVVKNNLYDCGITLASHSRHAVGKKNRLRPHVGGVYDNTITRNVADGNGTKKAGTGYLVAAAFSGGAAYDNRIVDNEASGNGLPGIALHSHDSHQNLDGNIIKGNVLGRNALGTPGGHPGDGDAGVTHTVGILVWSWVDMLKGTKISGNHIAHNYFGIWTQHVPQLKRSANRYRHVRVALFQREK